MRVEHDILLAEAAPGGAQVSQGQLWAALVLRAHEPERFMPALQGCAIVERSRSEAGHVRLKRRLDFGSFVVTDEATLVAPRKLVMQTQAGPSWPASVLTICIEAPPNGPMALRFCYEADEAGDSQLDAMTQALRAQAYRAADRDMVLRVVALANAGDLPAITDS